MADTPERREFVDAWLDEMPEDPPTPPSPRLVLDGRVWVRLGPARDAGTKAVLERLDSFVSGVIERAGGRRVTDGSKKVLELQVLVQCVDKPKPSLGVRLNGVDVFDVIGREDLKPGEDCASGVERLLAKLQTNLERSLSQALARHKPVPAADVELERGPRRRYHRNIQGD